MLRPGSSVLAVVAAFAYEAKSQKKGAKLSLPRKAGLDLGRGRGRSGGGEAGDAESGHDNARETHFVDWSCGDGGGGLVVWLFVVVNLC